MNHQVDDPVSLKVGNPDCSDFALSIQFFHRTPFTIHIAVGLMNKIQVKVIQLQAFQGSFKGFDRTFIAIALDPKFGCDKQFFSRNAALFDAPANRFFVLVGSGSVNMVISNLNRVNYASFTFGWISDLKNTETQDRDFNAIV
jgi:hypothetical protein